MSDTAGRPLEGKTAIVTGGARNIGRAIALALAADGADVVVNAVSDAEAAEAVAREVDAAGGRGSAHIADITDEDAVAAAQRVVILAQARRLPLLAGPMKVVGGLIH